MKRFLMLWIMIGCVILQGCASLISPWAMNKASNNRFIPVEMWTGGEWSGEKAHVMQPVETYFGDKLKKSITGPKPWHHPVTGEKLQVYERLNATKSGVKRQLFTLGANGRGLSKVYDERPGEPTRLFSTDAILFPVGNWYRGEKKTFSFFEYVNSQPVKREATIHIRRLSFTFEEVKYAIKYDYIVHDQYGKMIFNERFIYGPGKSLMHFENRGY